MRLDNSIHNYYEHLVLDYINTHFAEDHSDNFIADLICLTLNHLPPRYIRHEVDMAFYLPQSERMAMEFQVEKALKKSLTFLEGKYEI
ncbi:competence protein ComFB [Marinomonas sp. SBI22]|uniref:late competence development ComFB family protein n=1 Tax=unclassified Marinomonas TaxID=196814 RepID=UPI0005FA6650|nr:MULTISPECIES: late competence development ComFB family protein [unclassified Marinomonas]KJZ13551.1 competence protein ComFB [Marinomonas sp. S3726]KZM44336.1 competence protein ComFB [Marinomonas sp. SBI22]KZM45494.1 competence protein ComFB [Marinomonas sp. SBI8L]